MAAPILATKLYIPPPRPNAVLRPRLIDRLNEGRQRAPSVALISAPAGFGKTTLVSEWVSTLIPSPRPAVTPRKFNMPFFFWLPARLAFGLNKPRNYILGSEFAGEVEAIGSAVTRFKQSN